MRRTGGSSKRGEDVVQERKSADPMVSAPPKAPSDAASLALLLLLYTLQGIPMGLSGSIPFLLQSKISWTQQGNFSMVTLPFSLKLFWAPLVDSLYVRSFGRRKSWLVPVQIVCGLMMLWGKGRIAHWLGDVDGSAPDVGTLTLYFMTLFFLMATQDIAVDGWALTMLSDANKGYASTCNSVDTTPFVVEKLGAVVSSRQGSPSRLRVPPQTSTTQRPS